eukprot:m.201942 g.201942  ORF g.201942 m.201942 type:complete len:372 (+) comp39601_c1_seq7:251-1366(+)
MQRHFDFCAEMAALVNIRHLCIVFVCLVMAVEGGGYYACNEGDEDNVIMVPFNSTAVMIQCCYPPSDYYDYDKYWYTELQWRKTSDTNSSSSESKFIPSCSHYNKSPVCFTVNGDDNSATFQVGKITKLRQVLKTEGTYTCFEKETGSPYFGAVARRVTIRVTGIHIKPPVVYVATAKGTSGGKSSNVSTIHCRFALTHHFRGSVYAAWRTGCNGSDGSDGGNANLPLNMTTDGRPWQDVYTTGSALRIPADFLRPCRFSCIAWSPAFTKVKILRRFSFGMSSKAPINSYSTSLLTADDRRQMPANFTEKSHHRGCSRKCVAFISASLSLLFIAALLIVAVHHRRKMRKSFYASSSAASFGEPQQPMTECR